MRSSAEEDIDGFIVHYANSLHCIPSDGVKGCGSA